MNNRLLKWTVYEVTATQSALNGVQIRGRTRKFAVERDINLLIENTVDISNAVRFAVLNNNDAKIVSDYIHGIAKDAVIVLARKDVTNPVLSKISINNLDKYTI